MNILETNNINNVNMDNLQKNKYLLFIGGGIAILFSILFIIISINISNSTNKTNKKLLPSPTPTIQNKTQQVSPTPNIDVISTQPNNNATDVPLDTQIVITLNQAIDGNNVNVSITPNNAVFSTITNQNTIRITSQNQLQADTIYTLTIKYAPNVPAYIYAFRTIGAPSGDTFSFPHQAADVNDIRSAPDVFLARRTPYEGTDFKVNSELSDSTGYFVFTVTITSNDKQTAQQDFLNWALSQGLTQEQVRSLQITYQ